jgi:hypothetical protein
MTSGSALPRRGTPTTKVGGLTQPPLGGARVTATTLNATAFELMMPMTYVHGGLHAWGSVVATVMDAFAIPSANQVQLFMDGTTPSHEPPLQFIMAVTGAPDVDVVVTTSVPTSTRLNE